MREATWDSHLAISGPTLKSRRFKFTQKRIPQLFEDLNHSPQWVPSPCSGSNEQKAAAAVLNNVLFTSEFGLHPLES